MDIHESITEARENIAANFSTEPCVVNALLAEIDRQSAELCRLAQEVASLERENAKLRQLIEECRPYVLSSNAEGSAALYSRLIFNGPL